MSRTYRRKNIEKTFKSKEFSRQSGLGYYTQLRYFFVGYHPSRKFDSFSIYSGETKPVLSKTFTLLLDEFSKEKYLDQYKSLHYRSNFTVSLRFFSKKSNKTLRLRNKKYIFDFIKTGKDDFPPVHFKDAKRHL